MFINRTVCVVRIRNEILVSKTTLLKIQHQKVHTLNCNRLKLRVGSFLNVLTQCIIMSFNISNR